MRQPRPVADTVRGAVPRPDSAPPPEANPPVRRPDRGGFVVTSVVMAWRALRRMRTALILLAALAAMTLMATVVPQEPNVPATVAAWRAGEEGPGRAASVVIEALGGYDVYGAPAFLALLLLLVISLTSCLALRYRAWWRVVRRSRPPLARDLDRQPLRAMLTSGLPADEARARAREVLARHGYRVRDPHPGERQVAGEKGVALREGGSLVFHTSWYVIVGAIVLGQLLGFTGQVGLVEGHAWAETRAGYWSYEPGRWWDDGDHRGFELALDRFEVDWYRDTGQPRTFLSHVTVRERDGGTYGTTVGGNDPLVVDGMKIHQLDWGYAPRVVVMAGGEVVHDAFLTLRREGPVSWTGAVKAPAAQPGIGLELTLYPNTVERPDGLVPTGRPWTDQPVLHLVAYRGDLNLTAAQNVNELDRRDLTRVDEAALRSGFGVSLAGDVQVFFPELRRWVGLQVSHRPTVPWLLLGALLLLAGLLPALYAYRRRVWVELGGAPGGRVEASGAPTGGVEVTVAGRAFQRSEAFAGEHARLVAALREALAADSVGDGALPTLQSRDPAQPRAHDADAEVLPR